MLIDLIRGVCAENREWTHLVRSCLSACMFKSSKFLNIFLLNLVLGLYTENFLAYFMLLCICGVVHDHSIKCFKNCGSCKIHRRVI